MRTTLVLLTLAAVGAAAEPGTEFLFKVKQDRDNTMRVAKERLAAFGWPTAIIQESGKDGFTVRIDTRDKGALKWIKGLVTDLGTLEFRLTIEKSDAAFEQCAKRFGAALAKGADGKQARLFKPDDLPARHKQRFPHGLHWFRIHDPTDSVLARRAFKDDAGRHWMLTELDRHNFGADALQNVNSRRRVETDDWIVVFDIKKEHRAKLAGLTAEPGRFMAIIVNNHVRHAPIINSTLSENVMIEGGYTEESARALAALLRAGTLKHKPVLVSERAVGGER